MAYLEGYAFAAPPFSLRKKKEQKESGSGNSFLYSIIYFNSMEQRINVWNSSHKGTQPIRVLQHNVPYKFETVHPDFIRHSEDIIKQMGLDPGIGYLINEEPIHNPLYNHSQTPYVDENKKIHIHETFLSYLWGISYSLVVLYEEAVVKPIQNQQLGYVKNQIDTDLIDRTKELFQYARSLVKVYFPWDKNLPNPEEYLEKDKWWIERVNGIFVQAMTFILCHEFAHAEKNHFEKIKSGNDSQSHYLEYEREADLRAFELMMLGITPENKVTTETGILIALCSMLFFKRELKGEKHPDTDDRIHDFLTSLKIENNHHMWGLAAFAYRLWNEQFGKVYSLPTQVEDFKEIYDIYRKQIQEEKHLNGNC